MKEEKEKIKDEICGIINYIVRNTKISSNKEGWNCWRKEEKKRISKIIKISIKREEEII